MDHPRTTPSPKRFDEALIVALAEKNLLPVIATGLHVIEQSFGMNSRDDAASLAPIKLTRLRKV